MSVPSDAGPASLVDLAVEILQQGGLVAIPTETVYGLAADATSELAVRRIFAAKGRPFSHPLIVHLPSAEAAREWTREIPPRAAVLARAFWPGPLTLVLRRSGRALDVVTAGQESVALRVPAHPLALRILQGLGRGLAAPSANRHGRVSPTTADHVRADLGDAVDLVVDGGPCLVGVESTIVDAREDRLEILRPGGVPREDLEAAVGEAVPVREQASVRVPGMLASHYAPRAGVVVVERPRLRARAEEQMARFPGGPVAVVSPSPEDVPPGAQHLSIPADPDGFARELYAVLREADRRGAELVVIAPPRPGGLGLAIRDRLLRASAPRSG